MLMEEERCVAKSYRIPVFSLMLVRDRDLKVEDRPIVSHSVDASTIIKSFLEGADREHFIIVLLNGKNRIIGIHNVSTGSLGSSLVHPREVFKPAILANAAAIILAHNHPSGDPTPSQADLEITKRLRETGEVMGIAVLDHIIIGDGTDEWVSFVDSGNWK